MLFALLCSITTALCLYCVLRRVGQRSVEMAVRLAVRDAEKVSEGERLSFVAQLGTKDAEIKKLRERLALHEAVPTPRSLAHPVLRRGAPPVKRPPEDALHLFEMSRPFTNTSYDALLASSNVVTVEPAGGQS